MDSGNNSASLQSSSGGGAGGDEEYNSLASDSFNSSTFHTQNSSIFDPFANYFNPISRPQPPHNYTTTNSLFNTDWSKTLRSEQNNNPMMLLPSSNTPKSLSFGDVSFPSAPSPHCGVANVSVTTTTTTGTVAPSSDQPVTQAPRNPKKRSRASRRAPTTVLTTDTTNFRAMVQEFTGIPAPPFTSSYFAPRTSRFDLFAGASSNNNPLNISQPPNYLRRPFPQKIQVPPPFLSPNSSTSSSSSSSSSLMLSCLANNIASGSSSTSASNSNINYQPQLPSGVASSVTQSSNLFSTIQQNSILTSLLQSSQKYPLGVSKDQEQFQMPSNNSSQIKIGSVLEEYSMNSAQHGHLLSGLPNLISPEQATSSRNENIAASSTNFHGDNKVQETVASRGGEGVMESWICSSD
ncbi:uncharacterized protein LOC132614646 [Lycium barbarum]|uniref:uncharacterized protein LOC132614646 n=1 Tax=Lycium barbarum TaxID=112863 RepID=UPI00293E7C2A|nr:uncharacterized protein LOC132614646 [Lycium barbarum]